jgi:uncharacterized membrane protein YagU involved in acid resistance
MSNFFLSKAIKAGLLVATLDISAACIQTYIKAGKGPQAVLRYLASAVFGQEAFTGSRIMIFFGLLFHYIIAMSFALLFFWLAKKIPSLLKQKILTAIVYAVFMWSFMEFIVLPLTRLPHRTIVFSNALIAIGILLICISLPLSFMAGSKK